MDLPEENALVDSLSLDLEFDDVESPDVVEGSPKQGFVELGEIAGLEIGVWELREGVVTDTEVDEVFVVVAGEATVHVLDEQGDEIQEFQLSVGSTMRLVAGTKARWSVKDFIRKVYLAP